MSILFSFALKWLFNALFLLLLLLLLMTFLGEVRAASLTSFEPNTSEPPPSLEAG